VEAMRPGRGGESENRRWDRGPVGVPIVTEHSRLGVEPGFFLVLIVVCGRSRNCVRRVGGVRRLGRVVLLFPLELGSCVVAGVW